MMSSPSSLLYIISLLLLPTAILLNVSAVAGASSFTCVDDNNPVPVLAAWNVSWATTNLTRCTISGSVLLNTTSAALLADPAAVIRVEIDGCVMAANGTFIHVAAPDISRFGVANATNAAQMSRPIIILITNTSFNESGLVVSGGLPAGSSVSISRNRFRSDTTSYSMTSTDLFGHHHVFFQSFFLFSNASVALVENTFVLFRGRALDGKGHLAPFLHNFGRIYPNASFYIERNTFALNATAIQTNFYCLMFYNVQGSTTNPDAGLQISPGGTFAITHNRFNMTQSNGLHTCNAMAFFSMSCSGSLTIAQNTVAMVANAPNAAFLNFVGASKIEGMLNTSSNYAAFLINTQRVGFFYSITMFGSLSPKLNISAGSTLLIDNNRADRIATQTSASDAAFLEFNSANVFSTASAIFTRNVAYIDKTIGGSGAFPHSFVRFSQLTFVGDRVMKIIMTANRVIWTGSGANSAFPLFSINPNVPLTAGSQFIATGNSISDTFAGANKKPLLQLVLQTGSIFEVIACRNHWYGAQLTTPVEYQNPLVLDPYPFAGSTIRIAFCNATGSHTLRHTVTETQTRTLVRPPTRTASASRATDPSATAAASHTRPFVTTDTKSLHSTSRTVHPSATESKAEDIPTTTTPTSTTVAQATTTTANPTTTSTADPTTTAGIPTTPTPTAADLTTVVGTTTEATATSSPPPITTTADATTTSTTTVATTTMESTSSTTTSSTATTTPTTTPSTNLCPSQTAEAHATILVPATHTTTLRFPISIAGATTQAADEVASQQLLQQLVGLGPFVPVWNVPPAGTPSQWIASVVGNASAASSSCVVSNGGAPVVICQIPPLLGGDRDGEPVTLTAPVAVDPAHPSSCPPLLVLRLTVVPVAATSGEDSAASVVMVVVAVGAALSTALVVLAEPWAVEPLVLVGVLDGPCAPAAIRSTARVAVFALNPLAAVPAAAARGPLLIALVAVILVAEAVIQRFYIIRTRGAAPNNFQFPRFGFAAAVAAVPGVAWVTAGAIRAHHSGDSTDSPALSAISLAVCAVYLVAVPAAGALVALRLARARYVRSMRPAAWRRLSFAARLVEPNGHWENNNGPLSENIPPEAVRGHMAGARGGLLFVLGSLLSAATFAIAVAPPASTTCATRHYVAAALALLCAVCVLVVRPHRTAAASALTAAVLVAVAAGLAAIGTATKDSMVTSSLNSAFVAAIVAVAFSVLRTAHAAWLFFARRNRSHDSSGDSVVDDDGPSQGEQQLMSLSS